MVKRSVSKRERIKDSHYRARFREQYKGFVLKLSFGFRNISIVRQRHPLSRLITQRYANKIPDLSLVSSTLLCLIYSLLSPVPTRLSDSQFLL